LTRHGHAAEYLIIITGRELRGHLLGHPVYRAVDFDILPLDPGISASKPSHPVETHLLALVRTHLNCGQFLYSYEFDVTRRLQAQYVARQKDEDMPMWEIVSIVLSKYPTSVSSSALRPMTGSSGISKAGSPKIHVKLIIDPYRFLQSRFMDISISDLNNDVSPGRI
jgi:SacI homology domain